MLSQRWVSNGLCPLTVDMEGSEEEECGPHDCQVSSCDSCQQEANHHPHHCGQSLLASLLVNSGQQESTISQEKSRGVNLDLSSNVSSVLLEGKMLSQRCTRGSTCGPRCHVSKRSQLENRKGEAKVTAGNKLMALEMLPRQSIGRKLPGKRGEMRSRIIPDWPRETKIIFSFHLSWKWGDECCWPHQHHWWHQRQISTALHGCQDLNPERFEKDNQSMFPGFQANSRVKEMYGKPSFYFE